LTPLPRVAPPVPIMMFDSKQLKKLAAMQSGNPPYASETGAGALVQRLVG
jgi:hypothetical protein